MKSVKMFYLVKCTEDGSVLILDKSEIACDQSSVTIGEEISFFHERKIYDGVLLSKAGSMKKLEKERSEMQKRQKRASQLQRHLNVQLKNRQHIPATNDDEDNGKRHTHTRRRSHSLAFQSDVVTKKVRHDEDMKNTEKVKLAASTPTPESNRNISLQDPLNSLFVEHMENVKKKKASTTEKTMKRNTQKETSKSNQTVKPSIALKQTSKSNQTVKPSIALKQNRTPMRSLPVNIQHPKPTCSNHVPLPPASSNINKSFSDDSDNNTPSSASKIAESDSYASVGSGIRSPSHVRDEILSPQNETRNVIPSPRTVLDSSDSELDDADQLLGQDYTGDKMVLLGNGIYCTRRVFQTTVLSSTSSTHVVRRLLDGVFVKEVLQTCTITGQSSKSQGRAIPTRSLHYKARQEIIKFAMKLSEKNGWDKKTEKELRSTISQRLSEIKRDSRGK